MRWFHQEIQLTWSSSTGEGGGMGGAESFDTHAFLLVVCVEADKCHFTFYWMVLSLRGEPREANTNHTSSSKSYEEGTGEQVP